MNTTVKLGSRYKDQITEFEGVCTGLCQYVTGCDQALLSPKGLKDDGSTIGGQWFDVDRLLLTATDVYTVPVTSPGADIPAPIK